MTKQELLQCIIETLRRERNSAEQSLKTVRQAAIDAPSAMQSHSDTTKWQMSQHADAIQRLIDEKNFAIQTLQRMLHSSFSSDAEEVEIGSVVEVRNEHNEREVYFILPVGGGIKVVDNNRTITVITTRAPLAVALIGKRQNQTVKLQIGSQQREFTIVSIQ